MKKILTILAAAATLFASCKRNELAPNTYGNENLKLDISVSNPCSETKAFVKTAWAEDDRILIWYDTNIETDPDLVIKYNGNAWENDAAATVSGNTPSVSGNAKAVFDGAVKVAAKDSYTYVNGTLSFHLKTWTFLTELQVVVSGLTSEDYANYTLACDRFTPCTGYTVGEGSITASVGTKGAAAGGISNADGVAFVFATADYAETAADFKFTLTDSASGASTFTKNSVLTRDTTKINAIKIADSSFEAVTPAEPEYVEMKMGTGDSAYTLKWAKYNLGATTVAGSYATCYGDLYQWGSLNTLYEEYPWTSATSGDLTNKWKTGKEDGFVASNLEYTANEDLPAANDVAKQKLGGNWRMPTSQEFKDLYVACGGTNNQIMPSTLQSATPGKGIYWVSAEQTFISEYTGITGLLFCDGTSKLFFPATGSVGGDGKEFFYIAHSGSYWSSTYAYGSYVYTLDFGSSSVYPQNSYPPYRYFGYSVRPVKDEAAPAPTPTLPDGALTGGFTVNAEGKKVYFSKGNLTYDVNASTNKWKFYEHQYDCATGYDANLISLFTWGYDATKSIVPDGTDFVGGHNTDGDKQFSASEDWGTQVGDGNTWRTLTITEWRYLFSYDGSGSGGQNYDNDIRRDKYKYGVTVCGKTDCVVLLPDNWQWGGNVGTDWQKNISDVVEYNEETTIKWSTMEAAGAVCLPAAGGREGSNVSIIGLGFYWSSSSYTGLTSYIVYFNDTCVDVNSGYNRENGASVRLVTEGSQSGGGVNSNSEQLEDGGNIFGTN